MLAHKYNMAVCKGCSKFSLLSDCLKPSVSMVMVVRRSMAGHSKWANIKFKKMHRDIARAKILGRLHKEIATAVRENGPDPALNNKLEHLIQRAKATNMTKDKIEAAIKSGVKNTGDESHNVLIEGHGPGGCGILVDTLSSNKSRTRVEIKTLFIRNGGHVGSEGSVSFLYDHKGVINIENNWLLTDVDNDSKELLNKAEELAIHVGAEDVQFGRNVDDRKYIQFICGANDLIDVSNKLTKENDCTLLSASLEYLPRTLVEVNDDEIEKVHRLLERVNDHEDVMKTYDNVLNYPSDTYKYS